MKFITLTSIYGFRHSTGSRKLETIRVNVDMIGHYYSTFDDQYYDYKTHTIVGVVTHRNGGFSVKETPEEIDALIQKAK